MYLIAGERDIREPEQQQKQAQQQFQQQQQPHQQQYFQQQQLQLDDVDGTGNNEQDILAGDQIWDRDAVFF